MALFDVYLRLRPQHGASAERFLDVEEDGGVSPTHITIKPPMSDRRKRAVEKFAFTRVFGEEASQLDILNGTQLPSLIESLLAPEGRDGRDGLLATLGMTGSGKSHTILGTKTQRGLAHLSLDLVFKAVSSGLVDPNQPEIVKELAETDVSEAHLVSALRFLDAVYGGSDSQQTMRTGKESNTNIMYTSTLSLPKKSFPRATALPQQPRVDDIEVKSDETAEYAVIVSMYEVYNNGIFDLFTSTPSATRTASKDKNRRALLFKSTEFSQERKVVAGLKKVVCGSFEEAMLVLDAGLTERRVAGTKSNAVSSRSHGFFCIEVKKRHNGNWTTEWSGNTLTIADLAGSERADQAKTAGATLAEAGKINESLMYLGQCMQMQSDSSNGSEPNLVPYRSCKLTEILFSNAFQQPRQHQKRHNQQQQRAIMIVTADPHGDFNATSQILRYSALAREVTVPRIPSVTASIIYPSLSQTTGRVSPSGSATSSQGEEMARLQTELQVLQLRLQEETARRKALQDSWARESERINDLIEETEARVRAECMDAAEQRLELEQERSRMAAAAERSKQEEYLDGKVGILSRATGEGGFEIWEESDRERVEALEAENNALKEQVNGLESELRRAINTDITKTPSRKLKPLISKRWTPDDGENEQENVLS